MNRIATIAGASLAAVALGTGVASTATAAPLHGPRLERADRVTGPQAQKAIDAALAAVPGTADHAHKTSDGGYVVRVKTTAGKTVIVRLDANFVVTGQHEATGKRAVSDEQKAKASDAALVAVPGATVLDVRKDKADGFGVLVRTADGVKKVVKLDASYAVVSVQDAKQGRGHHKGADVTGEAFSKAEAAALSAVPGGTVVHVHKKGSGYHALVKKSDGTAVVVTLDANFAVTGTKAFGLRSAA